jgi:trehalose-6-phosphate hydrolase
MVAKGDIDGLVTVGEMSSTSLGACIGYTKPEDHELSMAFNFHHLKVDYAGGDKWALKEPDIAELRDLFKTWQEGMEEAGGWMALFWSNHDQPRPNSRFGDTEHYWFESSTLLPTCTHLMRGTPYIFQGEELGQTISDFTSIDQYRDVESFNYYKIIQERGHTPEEAFKIVHARSRDDGRTPMAWNANKNGGFSDGKPWLGLVGNYPTVNVETESADEGTVLAYFKRLIALRKAEEIIQAGDVKFLESPAPQVIAYERTLDDTRVVVQCNFSGEEQPALALEGGEVFVSNYEEPADGTVLRPWEGTALIWR